MNTITTEEWRDIPNFEGYYQVSNIGRVRSLDRTIFSKRYDDYVKLKGSIKKQSLDADGYPKVTLNKNNKKITKKVHILMALAFIGPRPEGLQVLHSDDVPTNNVISNLRYGTPKQNAEDRELNGNTQKGVKHFKTSLTDVEVLFARFIYADPAEPTVKDIAHSLGVNRSTAQDVISGRTWHHLKQYPYNRMKGRQPYKLTQDNLKQAIEMKEAGIPVKVIANHFHCSEDTIYRRIKQFKNENTTTTHT